MSNVRRFPAPSPSSSARIHALSLDPDDLASHGPPPLARPREMPYLDFDIYARQGQLSDSGFEGDLLTVSRRLALGLPVAEIKCRDLPRWVQIALRRQADKSEQDTAWIAVEAGLARLLSTDEVLLWIELNRAIEDPRQALPPELGNDLALAFHGVWDYAIDSMQSGVYTRNFRVPEELASEFNGTARHIYVYGSQLFPVLLLDGLRSEPEAYDRPTMDRMVSGFYRVLRKRVQRFAFELALAAREGEIVPTERLGAILDETEKRLWKTRP